MFCAPMEASEIKIKEAVTTNTKLANWQTDRSRAEVQKHRDFLLDDTLLR